MSLKEYRRKRDFERTPEPRGGRRRRPDRRRVFVVQKHAARRLHYDLRLELDGVLKSWAVPKGPSLDPAERRLAVHVEDHPLEYGDFEGLIPAGEYGAGTVMLWDRGEWVPRGDGRRDYRRGKLKFDLHGEKLRGGWMLVRTGGPEGDEENQWLLIKERDEAARRRGDVLEEEPESVSTGRTLEEIESQVERVWTEEGLLEGDAARRRVARSAAARRGRAGKRPRGGRALRPPDPARLEGARRAAQPSALRPELPTLVERVPEGDGWLHEIKLDGYRLLCFLEGGRARLVTRNGNDWTARFPVVAAACEKLPASDAVFDGEVVVLDSDGTTDFQALQNILQGGRESGLVYYLFDAPYCGGYDLTRVPLIQRKSFLRDLLDTRGRTGRLRYSDHIAGRGKTVVAEARRFTMEGIVSKRADSPYRSGRSRDWVKVKHTERQEFVVGGYTEPSGSRQRFGALLLGCHDESGRLLYCGRVGTGFTDDLLAEIHALLERRAIDRPPFVNPPSGREARGVTWVRPEVVAEAEFSGWTEEGILRHPSFKGLRSDKSPASVVREAPSGTGGRAPRDRPPTRAGRSRKKTSAQGNIRAMASSSRTSTVRGVRLTHPDRVLYPGEGVTKEELALFYDEIADRILPHLIGRPLTLLRCPQGRGKKCFYQKHVRESLPEAIRGIPVEEKGDRGLYISVDDVEGLISLVQHGALEFHPWGSRRDRLERPDRIIFDLDPGPGVARDALVDGARAVRDVLRELGLASFVKTSGGKGFHVVVPLARRSSWDEVKEFAGALARAIAGSDPGRYVATMSKSRREGRIFIDYLRNARGATSVAPYSTRAREGAPVSVPLEWEELRPSMDPARYTVRTLPRRLARRRSDPWEGFFDVRQSITKGMRGELGLSR